MSNETDRREIVITFKSEDDIGALGESDKDEESKIITADAILKQHFGKDFSKFSRYESNIINAKYTKGAVSVYSALELAGSIKDIFVSSIEYSYNRTMQLTDNFVMQREVDEAYSAIKKGVSFGKSAIGGALAGSMLGPVGAIVGSFIGMGTAVIKHSMAVSQNRDQFKIQMAQSTITNAYSRSRMGYYLTDMGRNTFN